MLYPSELRGRAPAQSFEAVALWHPHWRYAWNDRAYHALRGVDKVDLRARFVLRTRPDHTVVIFALVIGAWKAFNGVFFRAQRLDCQA